MSYDENDKVLYMSKLSRKIEHGGQKNLRLLGKVTKHHAIQVKTEKGGQYLIERTSDKDPKDPKSTMLRLARESIKKNSAYSAKNDPNPKVHTTQASTSKPKRKK
ncbi:hypothetical protein GLOIN_2v1595530 [Rhizophagus irregularis DAOM 181602=DAOM 197198]|nr:hypothetical protein GLOIN_2v1595530 [Rhizophagus irregularis DAOM 181602=DAOM 197198]